MKKIWYGEANTGHEHDSKTGDTEFTVAGNLRDAEIIINLWRKTGLR